METNVLNLSSPFFGCFVVLLFYVFFGGSFSSLFHHFSSLLSLFWVVVPKIFHPLFHVTNWEHVRSPPRNEQQREREKEEVITVRVSFPSVPLERKWCEYSSLSLSLCVWSWLCANENFFREGRDIYFFYRKERKKEKKERNNNFFSRERHERKKHKKEKKTAHKLCSHSGTCTRKQMKEGTERENGVNAGDACVRFWFSSARDWLFLRWKTRSFFFFLEGKRLFYNPGKEKKKKFFLVFEQAVFGWVSDEDKEKKNSIMKNNLFFLSIESRLISNWIVGFSTAK